jgi:hypothetical protein
MDGPVEAWMDAAVETAATLEGWMDAAARAAAALEGWMDAAVDAAVALEAWMGAVAGAGPGAGVEGSSLALPACSDAANLRKVPVCSGRLVILCELCAFAGAFAIDVSGCLLSSLWAR